MSDFLTRLAQLSQGEAPSIAPCLPSLFGPIEERPFDDGVDQEVPPEARATPKAETEQTTNLDRAAPATTTRQPAVESAANVDHENQPSYLSASNRRPAFTPLVGTVNTAPIEPVSELSTPSAAALQPTVEIERPRQRQQADPASTPLIKEKNQTAPPPVSAQLKSSHSSPLPLPLVSDYQSGRPSPLEAVAELPSTKASEGKQAPDIHINIGRIEVRAQVAKPAATPKPARKEAPSSLSLNDYLQRGGGRT